MLVRQLDIALPVDSNEWLNVGHAVHSAVGRLQLALAVIGRELAG